MNIYFAASIRGGRKDAKIYSEIVDYLKTYGTVLTEHVGDITLSEMGDDGPTDKYIHDRDLAWLDESDVLVSEVTNVSLGVGYEIRDAERLEMPVLCLYRPQVGKALSAMITGSDQNMNKDYHTLDEAKKHIDDFFRNIK